MITHFLDWLRDRKYTLIAMRLANMHLVHPEQVQGNCHQCGETVGIYPSGQAVLRRHVSGRVHIVCEVCHGPVDHYTLAPGALAEPFQSVRKP
jgi:hypothetical protein